MAGGRSCRLQTNCVNKKKIRPSLFIVLLTFTFSFTVYLFTLSPTVGLEDSGEFITAVYSLGIAHPSGYPLYVVLGKLFTLLVPFGEIAWRVNLFSAFCASATVGLLSLFLTDILSHLSKKAGEQIFAARIVRASPDELGAIKNGSSAGRSADEAEASSGAKKFRSPAAALIAASLSLSFAFSNVFWSQAVIAEVYTLNAFFVALTLFLLWRYWRAARAGEHSTPLLYWFAFVYGLSINNHQMMLLLAPVYLLFLFLADKKLVVGRMKKCLGGLAGMVSRRSGTSQAESQAASRTPGGMTASFSAANPSYLIAFLIFLLGLSFYLFVLFRAGHDPLLNWDHPETLTRLWRHFTRQSYGDISSSLWGDLWHLKKIIYIHFFFLDLFQQLTFAGAILAFIGFIASWFRARPLFFLSFGVFLLNSIAIIFLRKLGYQYEGEQVYRVYYIPAYLIAFLWAAAGAGEIVNYFKIKNISQNNVRRGLTIAGLSLLIASPALLLTRNLTTNDRSDFWLARDWGLSLLNSLEPDAVLLLHNEQPAADSQIFIIAYLTLAEGTRPDVAIVDAGYLSSRFYHPVGPDLEAIAKLPMHLYRARLLNRVWNLAQQVRRPVYTVYPVGAKPLNGDLIGRSNGLVFRIFPNIETARLARIPPAYIPLRNIDDPRLAVSSYGRDFVSDIHYTRAARYLEQGHFKISERELIEAFNLDQTPLSANTYDYMAYRARWIGAETLNPKHEILNKSK